MKKITIFARSTYLTLLSVGFLILFFGFLLYKSLLTSPINIAVVSNSPIPLPVTGTFLLPKGVLLTQPGLEKFFEEVSQNQIDTLVAMSIGNIARDENGNYVKERILSDEVVTTIFRLAKQYNIKTFWGTSGSTWGVDNQIHTVVHSALSPDQPVEDEAALIEYSLSLIQDLKRNAAAANVDWNDPTVAGIYIHYEPRIGDFDALDDYGSLYFNHYTHQLKALEPTKPILTSPVFYQADTYDQIKQAYTLLLSNSKIDIVSPQDTLGSGATKTFAASSMHFKALKDAVDVVATGPNARQVQTWANVESFTEPWLHYVRTPPSIWRYANQIAAAQPYVSKIITFTYQNSHLISPIFDNMYDSGANPAAERKVFYRDYLDMYSSSPVFADVPYTHPYYLDVKKLKVNGITSNCGLADKFCPNDLVLRSQVAVMLLRLMHGSSYVPPKVTSSRFADVPLDHPAVDWINQIAAEGVATNCGAADKFCPAATLTRAQLAVFMLRAKHGGTYVPPVATGVFPDVSTGHWAAIWIDQLSREGGVITYWKETTSREGGPISGCSTGALNFCPDANVTRAEIASFLTRTFNLSLPSSTSIITNDTLIPGDFTNTGDVPGDQVNAADFSVLVSGFGTTYTIFDYTNLVLNYNR